MNAEEWVKKYGLEILQHTMFASTTPSKEYKKATTELRKLLSDLIIKELSGPAFVKGNSFVFMVGFRCGARTEQRIVHNYVQTAIKRYGSLDPKKTGWFHNVIRPSFKVYLMPVTSRDETLKDMVATVKQISTVADAYLEDLIDDNAT